MDVIRFGHALLDTEDLDPVYVVLYRAGLDRPLLRRWLLAYWCFYHAGVASRIAEAEDFHAAMTRAQEEKWPRGRERRHFRGNASAKTIQWLSERFPNPAWAVASLERARTFPEVRRRITSWPLCGPWIAFKAADMIERVVGEPVAFSFQDLGFYSEPAAAAEAIRPGVPLETVVRDLLKVFGKRKAPPRYDRPCGIQEAETVLCKHKSHTHGHYEVGLDTRELAHALDGWGPLASRLARHLPEGKV